MAAWGGIERGFCLLKGIAEGTYNSIRESFGGILRRKSCLPLFETGQFRVFPEPGTKIAKFNRPVFGGAMYHGHSPLKLFW